MQYALLFLHCFHPHAMPSGISGHNGATIVAQYARMSTPHHFAPHRLRKKNILVAWWNSSKTFFCDIFIA